MEQVAQTAYTGAAFYGRFRAMALAVAAVIVCIVGLAIAWGIATDSRTASTTGTVTAVVGAQGAPASGSPRFPDITVHYEVDGVGYDLRAPAPAQAGASVPVWYDPQRPHVAGLSPPASGASAAIVAAISLTIGAAGVANAWLTWRSKELAAVEGVADVAQRIL